MPEGRIKPWGTCHAVLSCREMINGPFAVINADDFYGREAFVKMYEFLLGNKDSDKYEFSMIGYKIKNTLTDNGHVARGVCEIDLEGNLKSITERTKIMWIDSKIKYEEENNLWVEINEDVLVSMNFWGFTEGFIKESENLFSKVLESILINNPLKGEFYLHYAVDTLLTNNRARVKVIGSSDKWHGVTYKEDKESVVDALLKMKASGIYPNKLW